jgi:hypothetical protein
VAAFRDLLRQRQVRAHELDVLAQDVNLVGIGARHPDRDDRVLDFVQPLNQRRALIGKSRRNDAGNSPAFCSSEA